MGYLRVWKDGAQIGEGIVTLGTTPPPSSRRVILGSSTPPQSLHGSGSKEDEARWIERQIGHKLGATRHYIRAPGDWAGDSALASVANGRTAVISFTSGGDNWTQVAGGSLDNYIKAQVAALNQRGGNWLKAIIGFENEPEAEPSKGSPAQYVAAYEHIIKVARAAGLKNKLTTFLMEFTWQAGSGRNPEAWVVPSLGEVGCHGYSTRVGSCGEQGIRSFIQTFDGPHATAVKFGKRLGGYEGGFSTKAGTSPTIKGNFFRTIPQALEALPRMDAYVYWDMNGGKCDLAYSYFLHSDGAQGDPMKGFGVAMASPIANAGVAVPEPVIGLRFRTPQDWEVGDDMCPRCGSVMWRNAGQWRCVNCRIKGRPETIEQHEIRAWRKTLS